MFLGGGDRIDFRERGTKVEERFYSDDHTYAPIIVRRFYRRGTDAEFSESLRTMKERLVAPTPSGFVLDFGDVPVATAHQRSIQAAWLKENYQALQEHPYGTALVIRKAVQRFVLSSIYLVTDVPGRNAVVSSVEEAVCFVAAGMIAAHVPLPEAVRALISHPAGQPAGAVAAL